MVRAAPSLDWLDSGDLVASAFWMGIAHPPGEPGWLAPARLAQLLPLGDLAFRCTLLSAGSLALCAWPICGLVRASGGTRRAEVLAGLLALLGCSAQLQAVRPEVYAPTLLVLLLALDAVVQHGGLRGSAALGLLLGVAAGVHPLLAAAAVPALLLARLLRGPFGVMDALAGGAAGLWAFGVNLWLPLRALAVPTRAWGLPDTPSRFLDVLLARTFARNFGDGGDGGHVLHNLGVLLQIDAAALLPLLLPLAWIAWRRSTSRGARILALTWPLWWLGNALTVLPQNKVFGTNPDVHGYLMIGVAALAPLAAVGLELLGIRRGLSAILGWLAAGALLLGSAGASRRHDHLARRYTTELATYLPPGAVLMTSGNDAAFCWIYLQGVERRRADLVLIHRVLLGHPQEEARLGPLLPQIGLRWGPELQVAPLEQLAGLRRPFYLELREPEQAAVADGRLLRFGLVAGWRGVPGPKPDEPEPLVALRRGALAELASPPSERDPQARLVRAYYLALWGDAEPAP